MIEVRINQKVLDALIGLVADCDIEGKNVVIKMGFLEGYAENSYLWETLNENKMNKTKDD